MKTRTYTPCLAPVLATVLLLAAAPAPAMIPVIDVAAVQQLLMQLNAWTEQLRSMQQQLGQLRQTYGAMTGVRGMAQLLRVPDAARNYLPPDWVTLQTSLSAVSGGYPELGAAVRSLSTANAVLTPADLSRLPTSLRAFVATDRQAVASSQALSRLAYARASDRFASLATFIDKIGATPDAKAIEELQGRIQAEQAMLANEGLKLASMAQAAAAESAARDLARREQIVANHGSFATRFQPTPPTP